MKAFIATLFFCLFITSANAQDDMNRFPGWHKGWIGGAETAHRKGHTARFLSDATKAAVTPVRRMGEVVIHGVRPSGCPARAWCGCWLGRHMGIADRGLWLARNWARIGSATSISTGAIVVWRHHVGRITAVEGGKVKVLSGNDGGRVRERWRSVAGAIAFRRI